MLKHMLISAPGPANGGVSGRHVARPDSSTVMEPRIDPSTVPNHQHHHHQHQHLLQQQQQQQQLPQQRYRSAGNLNAGMPLRLQQQQPLNISTLTSSKHSLGGNSSSISPGAQAPKLGNGGLHISRLSAPNVSMVRPPPRSPSGGAPTNASTKFMHRTKEVGVKEMLVSLGLLCLVSLLLALLSLIFLLKISPVTANDIRELLRAEQLTVITAEEYVVVYEVTLALCALTLSLNLCCLLVCAIQFLFAVKLVKSPHGGNDRTNKYLQKSSISRVCAVAGFFISIPVFLTGIILYTFIQFHSTPAIVTSAFIGLGIVFCGCAMVHNVFVWQREKTNAVKALALQHAQEQRDAAHAAASSTHIFPSHNISITNPNLLNTSSHVGYSNHNHNLSAYALHPMNHSHVSAAHSTTTTAGGGGGLPYIIRPATTTPPTPTSAGVGKLTVAVGGHPREASGSVSPGVPLGTSAAAMDMSSVGTTNSPHELSTLV